MVNFNSVGGLQNISATTISGMDLETAMTSVQYQRAQLLETGIKQQLDSIAKRNEQIAVMNDSLNGKRTELAKAETDSVTATSSITQSNQNITRLTEMRDQLQQVINRDPNGWTGMSWGWAGDDRAKSHEMLARVRAEGLTDVGQGCKDIDKNGTMDVHGSTARGWVNQLNAKISAEQNKITESTKLVENLKTTQTNLKIEIDNLKSGIDAQSNSQQMDMLRLQSLSNKRNEAFDLLTNSIKKFQESRSSILGNMR